MGAMNNYKADLKLKNEVVEFNTTDLDHEVNWVTKGAVTPSRTKLNAVPAGPSPPPVPWRVLTSLPPAILSPSLRSNSSNALPSTPVATVVSWTTLSNTPRRPPWSLRMPTPTPLELVLPELATRPWKPEVPLASL